MKTLFRTALLLVCGFPLFACTPHAASDAPYRIEEGTIVFAEPARAEGQCDVLQLRCDPIPVVRVAFIGLGMRGSTAVERFTQLDGVEIVALCDKVARPRRAGAADAFGTRPAGGAGVHGRRRLAPRLRVGGRRSDLQLHRLADARPHCALRHGAGQARGRRGACGADRRRLLGAGRRGRTDAPPLA